MWSGAETLPDLGSRSRWRSHGSSQADLVGPGSTPSQEMTAITTKLSTRSRASLSFSDAEPTGGWRRQLAPARGPRRRSWSAPAPQHSPPEPRRWARASRPATRQSRRCTPSVAKPPASALQPLCHARGAPAAVQHGRFVDLSPCPADARALRGPAGAPAPAQQGADPAECPSYSCACKPLRPPRGRSTTPSPPKRDSEGTSSEPEPNAECKLFVGGAPAPPRPRPAARTPPHEQRVTRAHRLPS